MISAKVCAIVAIIWLTSAASCAGAVDDERPTPQRPLRTAGDRHDDRSIVGIIRPDLDAAALGRQIFVFFSGALSLWSDGRLDDGSLIAVRHGLLITLAAAATEEHRTRFVGDLGDTGDLGRSLERLWWQGSEAPIRSHIRRPD